MKPGQHLEQSPEQSGHGKPVTTRGNQKVEQNWVQRECGTCGQEQPAVAEDQSAQLEDGPKEPAARENGWQSHRKLGAAEKRCRDAETNGCEEVVVRGIGLE